MPRLLTIGDLRNGASEQVRKYMERAGTPAFDVKDEAPSTDADMVRHYNETGRLCIWAGASEGTVYGEPRHNWMYRAWHDWCHIQSGVCNRRHGPLGCFEPRAERDVTRWQAGPVDSTLFQQIVLADTGGQVIYYEREGDFPVDQAAFTVALVNRTGHGAIVRELEELGRFR